MEIASPVINLYH